MKNILITGSEGFIGKNLLEALQRKKGIQIMKFDKHHTHDDLKKKLEHCDYIFHLAGVNRPGDEGEFERVNTGLTGSMKKILTGLGRRVPIIFTSSIQVISNNPYGRSKSAAEQILREYANEQGAPVVVYRLTHVFGKWSQPNYNSVVATFCHNIARKLDIQVRDPNHTMKLIYIDDVVKTFVAGFEHFEFLAGMVHREVTPVHEITLGHLAQQIMDFQQIRSQGVLPDLCKPFTRALYATYLSFLDEQDFAYSLTQKSDHRGSLAEIIKSPYFGQIFISRSNSRVVRGNHYHNTKIEKFMVVQGEALIRFRNIWSHDVISYRISGTEMKVIDIPPGYTHSLENPKEEDLVVLFWASEMFDPHNPDTHALEV